MHTDYLRTSEVLTFMYKTQFLKINCEFNEPVLIIKNSILKFTFVGNKQTKENILIQD
jgi:hypothetical protein